MWAATMVFLQFNAVGVVATGNYTMTICYLNGDAVRYAPLSVNGGHRNASQLSVHWLVSHLGSIQITVTLNTGCNTLNFNNPIVGSWAPDFDRIRFNCPTCGLSPTPTAAYNAYRDGHSTPTPTSTPTATSTLRPRPHRRLRQHLRRRQHLRPDTGGLLSQFHDSGRVRCASVSTTGAGNTGLGWRALCRYHRQL